MEEFNNQGLLENVLRARDRSPLCFSDLAIVHSSISSQAQASGRLAPFHGQSVMAPPSGTSAIAATQISIVSAILDSQACLSDETSGPGADPDDHSLQVLTLPSEITNTLKVSSDIPVTQQLQVVP